MVLPGDRDTLRADVGASPDASASSEEVAEQVLQPGEVPEEVLIAEDDPEEEEREVVVPDSPQASTGYMYRGEFRRY